MARELDLTDKAVELMAFLSLKRDQAGDAAAALWPDETPARAAQLLERTVREINATVALATGTSRPVIGDARSPAGTGPAPRVSVEVLGRPRVMVYDDDEPMARDRR